MMKVRGLIDRGEFSAALDLMQPYLPYPERFPALYSDYLVILVWADRPKEAVRRFESLPVEFPKRSYLLRNMAKAYFDLQAYDRAHELYAQSLTLTPDDAIAQQGLIDTLLAGGKTAEALDTLEGLTDATTGSLAGQMLKTRLFISLSQYTRALEGYDRLLQARPKDFLEITRQRDNLFAGLSPEQQIEAIRQVKDQIDQGNRIDPGPRYNYILCLVLFRRYQEAVEQKKVLGLDYHLASPDKAYWYAWAVFKSGSPAEAEARFTAIIRDHPDYLAPKFGRIYALAGQARYGAAEAEIEAIKREHPDLSDNLELLFAEAYLFERQGHYWDAIQVYDRMLVLSPGLQVAARLRLRAFSDMGAATVAEDQATQELPQDSSLQRSIRNDQGVDRMHWEEGRQAVAILQSLVEASQDQRHIFDYIAALDQAGLAEQVVDQYEALQALGTTVPAWVQEIAAGAYTATGRPKRALELYDQVLAESPQSSAARMGKFHALQELRRWKEAEALLSAMAADIPAKKDGNGKPIDNPAMFELDMMQGWLLADQDRLKEADMYFRGLRQRLPANLEVRNAQAHIHLWRGWPRQALEEFNIINSLDPAYVPAQPGRLTTLNTLNAKKAAREQLAQQLARHPDNSHFRKVLRSFEVEQMRYLRTEVSAERDDDDTSELSLRQIYSAPLSLQSRLYTYLLWQPSWFEDEYDEFLRMGVGLEHRFNADWQVDGALSVSLDGNDPGLAASVLYTPDDYWSLRAYGNSFTTDIPRRARLADTKASVIGVEGTWRQSEWREVGAGFWHTIFSDGNLRYEGILGYEQNLWVEHDWQMRIFLDLYGGWNSLGDTTDYFNPSQIVTLSATYMIQQTLSDNNRHSFLHRLYLTLGGNQQKGYPGAWVGSIRYEQEHEFGDRHFLMLGIGSGSNVYDGDRVADILAELIYQWRF